MAAASGEAPAVLLRPALKQYAWGVRGEASLVAQVWQRATGEPVDPAAPYAELWLGTDPAGPALVLPAPEAGQAAAAPTPRLGTDLPDFLRENPAFESSDGRLPYLLKLLSNGTALSIQLHPDRVTAAKLHKARPDVFKTPNAKPEISFALKENVEALCGFKQWPEMLEAFRTVAPLNKFLEDVPGADEREKDKIRHVFTKVMQADEAVIRDTLQEIQKLSSGQGTCSGSETNGCGVAQKQGHPQLSGSVTTAIKLCIRLQKQYPHDVGCLAPFYLNYVVTQPGECLFTRPNVLHAYLDGQIVECMASSDNVIRGGLTQKEKNVPLLLETVNYNSYSAPLVQPVKLSHMKGNGAALLYDPNVDDFKIVYVTVPIGGMLTGLRVGGHSAGILMPLSGCCELEVQSPGHGEKRSYHLKQGTHLLLKRGGILTFAHKGTASDEKELNFCRLLEGSENVQFSAILAISGI